MIICILRYRRLSFILIMHALLAIFIPNAYASDNCQMLALGKLTTKSTNSQYFEAKLLITGKSPIDCEVYDSDSGEYTCGDVKVRGDQITTKDGERLRYGLANYKQHNECSNTSDGILIKTIRSWEGKIFETEYYMKFRSIIFTDYLVDKPIF